MSQFKACQGILALVEMVNFTDQAAQTGETQAYFQEKVKSITGKYGFKVVKSLGDGNALLVFGTDPEGFLDIVLDLFHYQEQGDPAGFKPKFRLVAHSGFFQFQVEDGNPVNLANPTDINPFRKNKIIQSWELVITHPLYQGLKFLATGKNIQATRLVLNKPVKGFDGEEWIPPFYKLKIEKAQSGPANLLERRMNELENDVRRIPVFGDIYPSVPMNKNFINLSMTHDGQQPRKRIGRQPIDSNEFDKESYSQANTIDVPAFYKEYHRAIIFGLPGAGKTTILRYLASQIFKNNETKPDNKKQIILFAPCRETLFYDEWYKDKHGTDPGEPGWDDALSYMTWVFLFGKKKFTELPPDQHEEFQNALRKVEQAFKEKRLTLLVDALDEAADSTTRERIKQLFIALNSGNSDNRFYLTSRPSERIHLKKDMGKHIPVFKVLSLTMDQVRAAARHLMEADSPIYKKFDEAVWQEEVVVKMAATPLTALLLSAFFQAYEKFEQRFSMYDLLLKFILLKVWENIKSGAFPFKNLELFFQEVKKAGFSEKHPETQVLYDALASICFQLFYSGKDGKIHRSVNEETLRPSFARFIRDYLHYNEKETAITEEEWFEQLKQDHLLLQAGAWEYVFIHAAVMEYMAAYYLMQQYQGEKNRFNEILKSCLKKKEFFDLETIPIASGSSLVIGFEILAVLRGLKLEPKLEPLHDRIVEMGFKCLAEVEWLLEKTLQGIRVESLKSHILNIVQKNRDNSDWVYAFLKQRVLGEDKNNLSQDIQYFDAFEKLSRNIFLEEYLDYNAFDQGDSELVVLRKQLLGKLVQKEIVEQWLKDKEQTDFFENVLQLDTPGYHPEDKNFNYYRELIGKELRGFFGSPNLRHSKSIRACAVTPDGKRVVSASDDNTLKMWDLESGKELRTFTGHMDYVRHCAITPDGKWLLSASDDKTLKLWELESGKEIRTFYGHEKNVNCCAVTPDGKQMVSASDDKTLKLWELKSGKEIRTFNGHMDSVNSCAVTPDGKRMVSASDDYTLKLWELESEWEIRTFNIFNCIIRGCAVTPDGKRAAVALNDHTLKLLDLDREIIIQTFTGHKAPVNSCAITPDGTRVASTSYDGTLKIWELKSGNEIRTFTGHNGYVWGCAVSPDGNRVVSVSEDKTLKIWNIEMGRELLSFTGHKDYVRHCEFLPDGKRFVSASLDNTFKLWDFESAKEIRNFTGHTAPVYKCAITPDGKRVVSASEDNTLKAWELESGKEIRNFSGHKDSINSCVVTPDGNLMISASEDKTLKIWELESGKVIKTLRGHEGAVNNCAVTPDGNYVVSASKDKTLKLWDLSNGKEILTFSKHTDYVLCCAITPDGKQVISASSDNTLKLWRLENGRLIRTFTGHKSHVNCCAISSDGKWLISVSGDNTLKLWEIATGKYIKSLDLPWVYRFAAISPINPALIITANENSTLTLFEFDDLK